MKLIKIMIVILMTMSSFAIKAQDWQEIDRTETRVFYVNPNHTGRTFEFKQEIIDQETRIGLTSQLFVKLLGEQYNENKMVYTIISTYDFNDDFTQNMTVKQVFKDKTGKIIYEQEFDSNKEKWSNNEGRVAFYGSVAKYYCK